MSRQVLIPPTDSRWADRTADAKAADASNRHEAAMRGLRIDGDAALCARQLEEQREGYMMVEIATNIYGFCVRDTMNDGAGVLFGGRSRPGTTQEEALSWARKWHAERPTHREVIAGCGFEAPFAGKRGDTCASLGENEGKQECNRVGHCYHLWSLDLDASNNFAVRIERCCWCGVQTNARVRHSPYRDLHQHGPHKHE